jgi:hypothetical protein
MTPKPGRPFDAVLCDLDNVIRCAAADLRAAVGFLLGG